MVHAEDVFPINFRSTNRWWSSGISGACAAISFARQRFIQDHVPDHTEAI